MGCKQSKYAEPPFKLPKIWYNRILQLKINLGTSLYLPNRNFENQMPFYNMATNFEIYFKKQIIIVIKINKMYLQV